MDSVVTAPAYVLPDTFAVRGFSARPLTLDDAPAYAALNDTMYQAQGLNSQTNPEEVKSDWQSPKFDLGHSSMGVFDADGRLVVSATVWDTSNKPVRNWLDFAIHPDHFDDGLGETLLRWGIERARLAVDRCPSHVRVVVRSGTVAEFEATERMMEHAGMQHIRYFLRMRIDMTEAPPEPVIADGISFRTYNHPDEMDAVIIADQEGFRDHWGFVERPLEELRERVSHWLETDPLFDPTVHWLAIDDKTGEIAGVCLCRSEESGDPDVAYVDSLAVLPAYRKRGIALALLHQAFGEFWRRGRKSVALHVDGLSLTGAVRLYERAGMHVDEKHNTYEYELRPGEDITTTSVD